MYWRGEIGLILMALDDDLLGIVNGGNQVERLGDHIDVVVVLQELKHLHGW
jgi:hypothetical protein